VAVTETVLETVAPELGEEIETVGGVTSPPAGGFVAAGQPESMKASATHTKAGKLEFGQCSDNFALI
jgi:hypothetical protein